MVLRTNPPHEVKHIKYNPIIIGIVIDSYSCTKVLFNLIESGFGAARAPQRDGEDDRVPGLREQPTPKNHHLPPVYTTASIRDPWRRRVVDDGLRGPCAYASAQRRRSP